MVDTPDVPVAVRPWRTPRLPELAGLVEATEILGREKSTVSSWLEPGSGRGNGNGENDTFLIEPVVIAAGPIWVRQDLELFAEGLKDIDKRGYDRAAQPEVLRPWRTYRLPELAGLKEAREILNVDKVTIGRWRKPGSGDIPPENTRMIPPRIVRAGPVWVRDDLVRYASQVGPMRRARRST